MALPPLVAVSNVRSPRLRVRAGHRVRDVLTSRCRLVPPHSIQSQRDEEPQLDRRPVEIVGRVRAAEHGSPDLGQHEPAEPDHDRPDHEIAPADVIAPTQAVLAALMAGGDYPSGEDARMALEALVAAYWSAENGNASIAIGDPRIARDRIFPWA